MVKHTGFFSARLTAFLLVPTLIVSASMLLTGCSSVNVPRLSTEVTGQVKAPLTPEYVTVYSVAPASYAEIAKISATSVATISKDNTRKIDEVVKLLQIEAAKLGANGIVLSNVDHEVQQREYSTLYNGTQGGRIKENLHAVQVQALAIFIDNKS